MASTKNGYDPRWVKAINQVLEDRDAPARVSDVNEELWDRFIGPMCDAIEEGEYRELERKPCPNCKSEERHMVGCPVGHES